MKQISSILRPRTARLAGLAVLVSIVATVAAAAWSSPALAASGHSASQNVALIPGPGPVPAKGPTGMTGVMPTSSYVTGVPGDSFARFSFTDLPVNQITPANLAKYDTIALIQLHVTSLSAADQTALARWVAGGGKLIIHDADNTHGNDYSWLLGDPKGTTYVGASCNACGSPKGNSTIVTNNSIVSANPSDASYVNTAQMSQFTDATGDSNLLVSTDPSWYTLAQGTNGAGDTGTQVAFAKSGNGLIIYNGYDTDYIRQSPTQPWLCNTPKPNSPCPAPPNGPTTDWLAKMWYQELAQPWGAQSNGGAPGLPPVQPVVTTGAPLPPGPAGLPPSRRCVARRSILLRLARFMHLRHQRIRRLDVYLNRRHVLRERRPFKNRTLRRLPRRGRYTVTVVATNSRGYHLIARQRYRAC